MECVIHFLRLYRAAGYSGWSLYSEMIASSSGKQGTKTWMARKLREWAIDFCEDSKLPTHLYGQFTSAILANEDIAADIHLHLQSLGKWVSAKQIVRYVATPEFQARLHVKRCITERTAQQWMKRMGYRWKKEVKGQYSNGHERSDVVHFCQHVFLPRWKELEARTRWWTQGHSEQSISHDAAMRAFLGNDQDARVVVIWRHDESTFYANDHRTICWVHETEGAKIKAKGEGVSLMIGRFVSLDYGWLKAKTAGPDGSMDDAEVALCPGKARDGYQTNEDILAQATRVMNTLDRDYPREKHVFAYDNAKIHTARAPDALSALKVTLGPSANFNKTKVNGVAKTVRMCDGRFKDNSPQSLYLPNGRFKGAKTLIMERRAKGHDLPDLDARNPINNKKLHLECHNFKCRYEDSRSCCLKKILYCEPDFQAQKSQLEEHCEVRGYEVIFFPKYHPELNFIEQCWGYAKRVYRMFPESTKEADLTRNVNEALESVPLESMQRFVTCSSRFADAYFHGLNRAEAAWTNKRYRGHRTLPADYLRDVENEFRAKQL
ncbi:unnamed protein product [Mycena citricolor]|uniref:Uncharacterized protein n=1 Tax=Mycena citricolor TaxID=2018698 RepID=A0AAD2H8T9_9AGAR|nr:unnamed protein product [Mycena citricolor]